MVLRIDQKADNIYGYSLSQICGYSLMLHLNTPTIGQLRSGSLEASHLTDLPTRGRLRGFWLDELWEMTFQ